MPVRGAIAMLVVCGETPVGRFVVPREQAPRSDQRSFGDVTVHRRELSAPSVFEVSPSATPRLLPSVYAPDG